ncbi:MAG: cation transporter [Asticcacaulis sp.]|nr:cation transporter [Asticcacaulis sp.]
MASESNKVVFAALIGNILVAVTKAVAAAMTGSSAMLSEAIHSFVDTGNEVLLLYGMHRSRRKPDEAHPLGYGRELYFWSFVVALLIFAVGAGGVFLRRHCPPAKSGTYGAASNQLYCARTVFGIRRRLMVGGCPVRAGG